MTTITLPSTLVDQEWVPGGVVGSAIGEVGTLPAKPSITSAIVTAGVLTLTSSAFSSSIGANHAASEWEVYEDTDLVFASGRTEADLTSITDIDVSGWAPGEYTARVRHQDDNV